MAIETSRETILNAVLEATLEAIMVVNVDRIIISHNKLFCQIFNLNPELNGTTQNSFIGHKDEFAYSQILPLLHHPDDFLTHVEKLYQSPNNDNYDEIRLKDGRALEYYSKSIWVNKNKYIGRVWFFRDVTGRKMLERKLEELSTRDPLTGVANRRHFIECVASEIARAQRMNFTFSLVYVDLDNFKKINDQFGHASGDRIINHFCRCTESILRMQDILGRIGGEEFAILLPNTSIDGAYEIAERLRLTIASKTIFCKLSPINYTISAGVTTFSKYDLSVENILARADDAMYAAKKAGRNRIIIAEIYKHT